MADVPVIVVGGGVVGLAIAAEISRRVRPLLLLERNDRIGGETSSRNSEVIHAGLYYPEGSLKARLCVEGNRMLYELCARHGIPCRRITKLVTATCPEEEPHLDRLQRLATANGAAVERLPAAGVHALEPRIVSSGGLFSPSTGIISAHALMDFFHRQARSNGADVQLRCAATGIERTGGAYRVTVDEAGERSTITTEWLINAAGLECDTVAALAGIDPDRAGYRLHWCKGSYFSLPASMSTCVSRLVYPVPGADSLGVHAVLDLVGRLRFGPDVEYLSQRRRDYAVPNAKRGSFAASIRRILPFVNDEDLTPDISGIRPKLQAPGGPPRDFIIREESSRGLPGMINLIGIDSPGLTSSPALARHVASLIAL